MSEDVNPLGRSPEISDFCGGAKSFKEPEFLGNLFRQAAENYRKDDKNISLDDRALAVAKEVVNRITPNDLNQVNNLHDLFNWIDANPNIPSITLEQIPAVSAAEGIAAGLEQLEIADPRLIAA